MKVGNLRYFIIMFFLIFLNSILYSQERLNLENIKPTFEEDTDPKSNEESNNTFKLKTKIKKKNIKGKTVVKFKALDKITAKTSHLNIPVGKIEKFGYLEILPKKCSLSKSDNDKGVVAYIQVKDLSNKKDDKVFVFNGWTFSSSPSLRSIDHPFYDLWLISCENV